MFRTDDPIADFLRHDEQCQRNARRLPRCVECGEPIQDEYAYCFDGEWTCEDCMQNYRQPVDYED